jgi:hypothetical protein
VFSKRFSTNATALEHASDMADLDSIVKDTISTLGKIIKKPPLSEKHLKKPPFRFVHDIVFEVWSLPSIVLLAPSRWSAVDHPHVWFLRRPLPG